MGDRQVDSWRLLASWPRLHLRKCWQWGYMRWESLTTCVSQEPTEDSTSFSKLSSDPHTWHGCDHTSTYHIYTQKNSNKVGHTWGWLLSSYITQKTRSHITTAHLCTHQLTSQRINFWKDPSDVMVMSSNPWNVYSLEIRDGRTEDSKRMWPFKLKQNSIRLIISEYTSNGLQHTLLYNHHHSFFWNICITPYPARSQFPSLLHPQRLTNTILHSVSTDLPIPDVPLAMYGLLYIPDASLAIYGFLCRASFIYHNFI